MSLPTKVAKMRFMYHANMLDVYNVLNQLGIVKDDRAERVMKNHCMKSLECLERLGYPVQEALKKEKP